MEQKINELSERLKLAITVVENTAVEIAELQKQWAAEKDRNAQPEPDMQDPNNWQEGDIIVATKNCAGDFTRGGRYVVDKTPDDDIVLVKHADNLEPNGWFVHNFIWIGRPQEQPAEAVPE